jgi:hypothetical protein
MVGISGGLILQASNVFKDENYFIFRYIRPQLGAYRRQEGIYDH